GGRAHGRPDRGRFRAVLGDRAGHFLNVLRGDPMAKQWYIVPTSSGHENKAMQALLERAKAMGKADLFDEVLIPEETVVEMVKGSKRTSKRKYFPGYILVRMELTDEA